MNRREAGHLRIGVPPGVGDVYWALCKLKAFREAHKVKHVTLCVKSSQYDRAGAWFGMCPYVDAVEFVNFESKEAEESGVAWAVVPRRRPDGTYPLVLDVVLWPNAVVDKGRHLSTWLPRYELDQSWTIATAQPAQFAEWETSNATGERKPIHKLNHVAVYASSEAINKAWAPKLGAWWWSVLLEKIEHAFGVAPILIGAEWDLTFRAHVKGRCFDFVGQTSLPEVAWILEHSKAVVGIISGMTILANHFRTPTIAIYPPKHHPLFPTSWLPADAPYLAYASSMAPSPANLVEQLLEISK